MGRKERPTRLGGTKQVASHTLTALAWEADRGERHVRGALSLHADERDDDNHDDDGAA